MIATGGTWDSSERFIYFLAGSLDRLLDGRTRHKHILLAVNELNRNQFKIVDQLLSDGARVLLDSGIFWLANNHKRAHGISMDDALSLAPDRIDGFAELWDAYIAMVDRFGDRVWGYIELDQGGAENKRKTRARLNSMGYQPMPVYHPLNDGWAYYDELAQTHDRICYGNIVQADAKTRRRLLATAWERHRTYPDLWVHVLGLTPNATLNAFPCDSADSSTWLNVVRWAGLTERAMMQTLGHLDREFMYVLGEMEGDRGAIKSCQMSALSAHLGQRGWAHWQNRVLQEFDLPTYPPLAPQETE